MRRIIYIGVFLLLASKIYSQCTVPAEQNLNKYWEYRERLKNFIVPGDCMGCSMPSQNRSSSELTYNDSPSFLGYYIGVLATEWYLLGGATDTASINQRQRDVAELYYAVKEVYTLDSLAKVSWEYWYRAATITGYRDGFLIRDNVPDNFPDSLVNGNYIANYLSKSLSPVPEGTGSYNNQYNPQIIASDWKNTQGIYGRFNPNPFSPCDSENTKFSGPNPLSQDEYSQLMIGFALVSKYIPSSLIYNGQSIEGMVQDEQAKIFNNIQSNNWFLTNTITNHCNTGVNWHNWTLGSPSNLFDPCKCAESGSDIGGLASIGSDGINACNNAILYNFTYHANALGPKWLFIYPYFYMSTSTEWIMLAEGTIGNAWGTSTPHVISHCVQMDGQYHSGRCYIYPLLYEALWAQNVSIWPELYYEELLSCAPCHGVPPGGGNNPEWSSGNRMYVGTGNYTYSDVYPSLDYLLYFNLFNIADVSVYSHSYVNYTYQNPKNLRYAYLQKQAHAESYEKNFWASDSIKAGNFDSTWNSPEDYIIYNANYPERPLFQGRAQVSFKAGDKIDLLPGFDAREGVLFDAAIDTSIHTMDCTECVLTSNLDSLYLPTDTVKGDYIGFFTTDSIISRNINCSCDTLHLFGINGDTAKISSWNWDFGNGQTSTTYNPTVIYCPAVARDTSAPDGAVVRDTTYLLTLIVRDSANYFDTLQSYIYIQCGERIPHTANHQNNQPESLREVTTFKILNTLTMNNTTIQYHLPQPTIVNMKVYNTMGVSCGTLANNIMQNAGDYTIPLIVQDFLPGMYFITMQAGNFVQTKKFVVIK